MASTRVHIDWENFDVDDVLGENWADDLESDWSISSDGDDDEDQEEVVVVVENKKTKGREKKERKAVKKFKCPLCDKEYASTSGFRGHVIKKHNRPDLKAISNVTGVSSCNLKVPLTTSDDIKDDLPHIVKCALLSLSTDEIHLCSWSKCGPTLALCAEQLLQIDYTILRSFLSDHIVDSFTLPGPPDILKAVFQLRINETFICGLTNVFRELVGEIEYLETFSQRFLSCFVKAFFQRQNEKIEVTQKIEIEALTDGDKENIHHITGAILRKMKKRYHNRPIELGMLDDLLVKNNTDQRCSWTHRLDKGGLLYPSSKFLNLMILIERWIRELVNSESLRYDSLINIKCTLLEYPLVIHLWEKLVVSQNRKKWLVLENILGLFVKIRGFALTGQIKSKLQKSRKQQKMAAGARKALRKDLKNMKE